MAITLEVACFSPQAIDIATAAGAHRLEFSAHYQQGGISPDLSDMKFVRGSTPLPLSVMTRPRGGDFYYTKSEKKTLVKQARTFAEHGADTIIFGSLLPDGSVDYDLIQAVCKAVHPTPCAFSRAFDRSTDMFVALEQLKDCDVQYVVTSGGMGPVVENISLLKKLLAEREQEIELLIAGGIRSTNVHDILEKTKVREIHSSCITEGELPSPEEIKKLLDKLKDYTRTRK